MGFYNYDPTKSQELKYGCATNLWGDIKRHLIALSPLKDLDQIVSQYLPLFSIFDTYPQICRTPSFNSCLVF